MHTWTDVRSVGTLTAGPWMALRLPQESAMIWFAVIWAALLVDILSLTTLVAHVQVDVTRPADPMLDSATSIQVQVRHYNTIKVLLVLSQVNYMCGRHTSPVHYSANARFSPFIHSLDLIPGLLFLCMHFSLQKFRALTLNLSGICLSLYFPEFRMVALRSLHFPEY